MIAPNGPVAPAKVRGSEKMPAPTMPPTTIMVSAKSDSFCVYSGAIGGPLAGLRPCRDADAIYQKRQPSLSAAPTCQAL